MASTSDSGCSAATLVGGDPLASVRRLAELLAEPDEQVWQRHFNELGIECDSAFVRAVKRSAKLCRRGFLLYSKQGDLAISFNGGKDACVALYLWIAAVLVEQGASQTVELPTQTAIYFDSTDEFDSVREFVMWVVKSFSLQMEVVEEKSFRQGMVQLVSGGLRAVVMGQRRGDPWMTDVDAFSPSTDGWPAFMRVNPIIEWSYGFVWTFLRGFGLPYCKLYDEGYTSLGSVKTTLRNPSLRRPDGSYAPAYALENEDLERAGRLGSDGSTQKNAGTVAVTAVKTPGRERSLSDCAQPQSAGIVVIGNELLNGKVHESNSHFLCRELHKIGVYVSRIEVVPDHIDAIAPIVKAMSSDCDFVFTSGGLGPTHDDVTMAGVASAFHCELVTNERLFSVLKEQGGGTKKNLNACHKMASVPAGSLVEWPEDGNPWPIVSMQNVYIFAGMPNVFRSMFERAASDGRFEGARRWISATLKLDAEEADILDALQQTVDTFPRVEIGSYPATTAAESVAGEVGSAAPDAKRCRLTITFEAFDEETLMQAQLHLSKALPADIIINSPMAAA